jgi:urea carboxylase-associated protein 2
MSGADTGKSAITTFESLPALARAAVPEHSKIFSPELTLWRERMPGGLHWSGLLRRGNSLRITALGPRANVSALFYNFEDRAERYNMPDTLKAQSTAYIRKGLVCYSDMGRVLCSIADSNCDWHDTIGGLTDATIVEKRYGIKRYQEHRNAMHRNGRDGLLIELGKWGLGKRDLVPTVNFFSKAVPDEAGRLHFVNGHSREGDAVELRFEMSCIVVLSTAPHPLDPKPVYAPAGVRLSAWRGDPVAADDACRNSCPQNQRAFVNTERYLAA